MTTQLPAVKFPSPCGDYGSYRTINVFGKSEERERFRPLAGIMVLIETELAIMGEVLAGVSVPLRGLWFLSFDGLE